MRSSSIIAASVALVAGANAHYSYDNVTYTTEVVTAYTTVCPTPTEIVHGTQTYTVTESTVLTITNCPCTVTKPVYTAPVYTAPVIHSSAYIPSTVVFTTPVATIASSSPVPYTSTIPVPYTSEEVVYSSSVVFTTPVATIPGSSPVPYTSTIPVPYTSKEVVYTSSIPVVSTRTSVISIEVSTSIVQVPTNYVEVPTSPVEVPTTRGPVPTIPVFRNATSTYVAPPAGTATGGAPAATTSNKAFLGAANKAFAASGASLAGLLGLAAILL